MNTLALPLSLVLAYLLGSVPTAVWTGKIFYNIDIREHGSGNAGATNTVRVLGWKTGIPVLIIDLGKGYLAAMMPLILNAVEPGTPESINIKIIAGILAITGHIFPVFAGFRGGKGVASAFGVLLAIHPGLTAASIAVFLLIFLTVRIVSLASIIAGLSFPALLFTVFSTPSVIFSGFSVLLAAGLVFNHRKNIARILKGKEPKLFSYRRQK